MTVTLFTLSDSDQTVPDQRETERCPGDGAAGGRPRLQRGGGRGYRL